MKRTVFLAVALFALMAVGVYAQTEADFVVRKSEDGKSITITGYKDRSVTMVNIPAKIQNLPVTSIYFAFSGCDNLKSVTIPDSVTSIRDNAFEDCKSLASITIPNSVTSIGDSAFSGCSGLTSVTFSGSIPSKSFNADAFYKLGDIRDKYFAAGGGAGTYTRPDGKSTTWTKAAAATASTQSTNTQPANVPYNADSDFGVSKSGNIIGYVGKSATVNIPPSIQNIPVTAIGESAFDSNSTITSVIIPNSVTSIGDFAFMDCTKLASVTIGSGVTSIGNGAFGNSPSLTSVTFGGSIPASGFATKAFSSSLGDIRAKYLAASGGAGTYTRPSGGTIWTKK